MHQDGVGVARGQQVGANADRRAAKETVGRRLHDIRQLHAAQRVVLRRAEHAAVGKCLACVVRALGQDDALTVELGLLRVHRAVERRVLLARDALAGVQHSVKRLARVVRKALARIERFSLEPVVEQEVERGAQGGGHARNYGRDGPMKPVRWVTRTAGVHWIARWNTGASAKSPSRRLGIARHSGVRRGGH